MKPLKLDSMVFGRLTVKKRAGSNDAGRSMWRCSCSCRRSITVQGKDLVSGNTKSCGCLNREATRLRSTTHGMYKSPERIVWQRMKQRCFDKNDRAYPDYGGRGITVCKRWLIFANFYADMGRRPSRHHTIERRNFNGDYKPNNCLWLLKRLQSRNARSVVLSVEISKALRRMKRQHLSIAAWADANGIHRNTAYRAANGETWR